MDQTGSRLSKTLGLPTNCRTKNPDVTKNKTWPKNSIDAFVLHKLQQKNIKPSPEADRYTLIRRVSLDLIGLPPSIKEVDQFVNDKSPDAYKKLVERLLASPHYGERWGKHWLDQARYADSDGYTVDRARSMWPYRDWVINAFNNDIPFDQFTIEQLAGDLLPKPTINQKVATGFHRNTLINIEGGIDKEQFRNEIAVDRTNTTGAVWLGLTVGCAQCHTHKFDPITQKEYYQLFAFFNQAHDENGIYPSITIPTEKQKKELKSMNEEIINATKQLQLLDKKKKSNPNTKQKQSVNWQTIHFDKTSTLWGAKFEKQNDQSYLVTGNTHATDEYTLTFHSSLKKLTALRLEVLTNKKLPQHGPGRAVDGGFFLTDVIIEEPGKTKKENKPHPFQSVSATYSEKNNSIAATIDAYGRTGWSVRPPKGKDNQSQTAYFLFKKPIENSAQKIFQLKLKFRIKRKATQLGCFRISVSDSQHANTLVDSKRFQLQATITKLQQKRADSKKRYPTTMVMANIKKPRTSNILIRGDFLRKGDVVTPNTPAFISALPKLKTKGETNTRLHLAKWLVKKENPLTARVTINRIWMHYFGTGLVQTENDFGMQGSLPTHPKLLDWLAAEFIKQKWSMKNMHRLIVHSATYKQSSNHRTDLREIDPTNKLLARQSRVRVDAEIVRDLALSASGLLSEKIGGKPVFPPQPPGVYAFTQRKMAWTVSKGEDRYRRGMYTFFRRSAPYPMLTTFDTPKFNTACTSRNISNTPLQSLTLSNDETIIEMARVLGQKILQQSKLTDEQKLITTFRSCLTRKPNKRELVELKKYILQQQQYFQKNPKDAISVAGNKIPKNSTPKDAATWTALARLLMNLDEFITRE